LVARFHVDTDFLVYALAIAALHRDAVLLTRNARDFSGVEGLRMEKPAGK
jgi:predicted nucleic acid-binding protein